MKSLSLMVGTVCWGFIWKNHLTLDIVSKTSLKITKDSIKIQIGDRKKLQRAEFLVWVITRAGNESSRRLKFHNHGEGPYFTGWKRRSSAFIFNTLLRRNAQQALTHIKYTWDWDTIAQVVKKIVCNEFVSSSSHHKFWSCCITLTNQGFLCSYFWYMSSLIRSTSSSRAEIHISTARQCGEPGHMAQSLQLTLTLHFHHSELWKQKGPTGAFSGHLHTA